MEIAFWPTDDQLKHLQESCDGKPFVMLNLLKFRDIAEYDDGRPAVSGESAYAIYLEQVNRLLEAMGARIVHYGPLQEVAIGQGADAPWDAVLCVYYPSRTKFLGMLENPDYPSVAVHRQAGLIGQLLIASPPTPLQVPVDSLRVPS
ncbi:MAG: DUF1330 domain-containing protein [Pseudomonadota bacterium]